MFVDDEPAVLDALRRGLYKHRGQWRMRFVEGGAAAVQALSEQNFDAVICDLRMAPIDGATVLEEARRQQPDAFRLVLSGYAEVGLAMRCVLVAHQHLSKPCSAAHVLETVQRAMTLRALCQNKALRRTISTIGHLPASPRVYFELLRLLSDDDSSTADVAELVGRDTAMTAKILQVANSSFIGAGRPVSSIRDAVERLGTDTLKSLTLAIEVFVGRPGAARTREVEALQKRALLAGRIAHKITVQQKCGAPVAARAMTAAILADVGMLVLLEFRAPRGVESGASDESAVGAEPDHAQVGACLLGTWGLPDAIVEAVAYHHHPCAGPDAEFVPLTAVHVAHALCSDDPADGVDEDYLARIGCAAALPSWRAIATQLSAETA